MLISTIKHNRIVAEKDAEIAGLMKRLEGAKIANRGSSSCIMMLEDCNAVLQARLAPFTKMRNRDSRGRFIKDTVA